MAYVESCSFSKERADEHHGEYCLYNRNGQCKRSQIKIEVMEWEGGVSPVCVSGEWKATWEEEQPYKKQRLGFGLLEGIRKRRLI